MGVRKSRTRLSPAYWRLLTATGVDNIGNGAYVAAVPLLAVSLTTDPRLVTAVSAAAFLPWLVTSLPAGAFVDRCDRVGLMWRAQLIAGVVVFCTTLLIVFDQLSIATLAISSFGLGTCEVLFGNAAQAVLPDMVPRTVLHRANGNQQVVITAGQQFVGPPMGSGLFALGAAWPFGVNTLSFLVSASLVATLPKRSTVEEQRQSAQAATRTGVSWLRHHRLMRTLAALLGVNTFCGQMANAVLVLLATEELHVTIDGYGVLLATAAVGSVLGGIVNARIVFRIGALSALVVALLINVAAFIAIGVSTNAIVMGAFLAANGFATMIWNVVTTTLRQQLVPPEMLGRVTSIYKLLGRGLIPFGTLTGGMVAHSLGARAPYELAGAVRLLALVIALPTLTAAMRAVHDTEP